MFDTAAIRTLFCRSVIYGLPCLTAAITLAAFYVGKRSGNYSVQQAVGVVVWANMAVAVIVTASATVFLQASQRLRFAGALAYAVLAFLIYLTLTLAGIRLLGG